MSAARRSTRRCRTLVVNLVLGGALLVVHPASAQDPPPAPSSAPTAPSAPLPARRVVEVLLAGAADDGTNLEDTVRELLGRLALITESQTVGTVDADDPAFRSTARPSLLARVGIDLRQKDVATILIVDGRSGEVVVRRTVRRDASVAVVREEVAHVVESAMDPLLAAERDRQNTPPPPPAPAPPPIASVEAPARLPDHDRVEPAPSSPPSPLSLDVVTAAGAGAYAPGAGIVARAGGGATLVWRRGLRPGIALTAHYVFPFETGDSTASAHVGVVSIRAVPSIEFYANELLAFDALVGGGLDVLHVEPRTSELPSDLLGPTVTRVDPLLTVGINTHLSISGGTSVSLLLGTDIDPASRHWVVANGNPGGGSTTAFAPDHVRPIAMLGFSFTAFGESRFGSRGPAK